MFLKLKSMMRSIMPGSLVAFILRYKYSWGSRWAKKSNVGLGGYIAPSVQVLGWRNVKIGKRTFIGEDTLIIVNCRQECGISIMVGNNCLIGRRNYISCGGSLRIGDYCLTAPDCRFLGGGHIYSSPFVPYISAGTPNDKRIQIGANCWFGVGAIVLDGVEIGHGCVIGAGTVVNRNIPPFSVVVGSPARIIKRFDMDTKVWINADCFLDEMQQLFPNEADYVNILRRQCPDIGRQYYASSKSFGDLV